MEHLVRKLLVVAVAGALASLLTWLPAGAASDAVRGAAASVTVGNNFSPTGKTVRSGGSVSWVWRGGRTHNVVGKNDAAA